ncbi:hypothetical protein AAW14_15550 [Streptomyces hygroscopicus]|nr:hypothetical protein [Streptomyces hygroscopicus]
MAGPYVDYLCSDEYSLTLSAPVHLATRGPDFAAVLEGARADTWRGLRLIPCDGVPLVLVPAVGG